MVLQHGQPPWTLPSNVKSDIEYIKAVGKDGSSIT